jgi:hypothetical protein
MLRCAIGANVLHRPCLHDQRPELFQSEIILKLAKMERESGHVEVAIAKLVPRRLVKG